jgi:DNA (cytosine-5)-methyltransferase 1
MRTLTTKPELIGKTGSWLHPTQPRILSVREAARAQGFPDSYRFAGSVESRYKQIGNAVPPTLARALGGCIAEAAARAATATGKEVA